MRTTALAIIALLVTGCGGISTPSTAANTPTAVPTSSATKSASTSPVQPASPAIDCPADVPLPGGCTAATTAILAAVGQFGLAVQSIRIQSMFWPCGRPFLNFGTSYPPACPAGLGPPTAWVEFIDTDQVAALSLTPSGNQIVVTVDAFGVPPTPGVAPA